MAGVGTVGTLVSSRRIFQGIFGFSEFLNLAWLVVCGVVVLSGVNGVSVAWLDTDFQHHRTRVFKNTKYKIWTYHTYLYHTWPTATGIVPTLTHTFNHNRVFLKVYNLNFKFWPKSFQESFYHITLIY